MPTKSPQDCRKEAQRMRAQAAISLYPEIKEQLLKIAAEYERLANYMEDPRNRPGPAGT
jgi:hypothetical protein